MKRVLIGVLAICFSVLLALPACGPAGPAEPVSTEPVKVAAAGHMGIYCGDDTYMGANMAVEDINKVGGVLGRPLELVKCHTNELVSVTDAASAWEKLITVDKVKLIVGGVRTESMLAQQDVACDYKVIHFAGGCAHFKMCERVHNDYDRYKYFFRENEDNDWLAAAGEASFGIAADALKEELGIENPKVAILGEKAIASETYMDHFCGVCKEEYNAEIVGKWFPSANAKDLTAEFTAIKASGAQIIYTFFSGAAVYPVAKQWHDLKIPACMSGLNSGIFSWETLWKVAQPNYLMTYGPGYQTRVPATPKTVPWYDRFVEKYDKVPSFLAAVAYDELWIWKEAVERAGTFDSDAVVPEIEKSDYIGVQGRIVFAPKEDPLHAHSSYFGKGYWTGSIYQLIDGELYLVGPTKKWPKEWDTEYPGTVPYQIPPWVLEYWKGK